MGSRITQVARSLTRLIGGPLLGAALVFGCSSSPPAGSADATAGGGGDPFGGIGTGSGDATGSTGAGPTADDVTATMARLQEVLDQLEAGDWRPYLALRSEVAAGDHRDVLVAIMTGDADPSLRSVAAVVAEDPLTGGEAPTALLQAARPVLQSALADAPTTIRPLAIRTLGRLPRGTAQDALLARLDAEPSTELRPMLLAALGDHVDAAGAATLRDRVDLLGACSEIRHGALAARTAADALAETSTMAWLEGTAAPRILGCAESAVLAGGDPNVDLHALTRSFDQPSSVTLVQQVLLGDVDDALKRATLAVLQRSGDPSVGSALQSAMTDLEAAGLGADAKALMNALRGEP